MHANIFGVQAILYALLSIGKIMKLPDWTKPALAGAGTGAVVLAFLGFTLGGWLTGGSAQEMADKQTQTAVAAALTPYCVLKSRTDPDRVSVQEELDTSASYQHQAIIEKAGWATPLGEDTPNHELARSCLKAMTEKS